MNLLSLKLSRVETQILIYNLQLFYHVNLVANKILAAMKPKEKKIFPIFATKTGSKTVKKLI